MKHIPIIIFLITNLYSVTAQNLKLVTTDWGYSSTIKERYYTLNSAPYYKQGQYEAFDNSGGITHKLNYNKGELDGIQVYYLRQDDNPFSFSTCLSIRKPMHIETYKNGKKSA